MTTQQYVKGFIPVDRVIALATSTDLPIHTQGAALFADISGFTDLTQKLEIAFGSKKGAELLTYNLNKVYTAIINELHNYHGSVIGFSGDAITCWFDQDDGRLAISCAMRMQQVIEPFLEIDLNSITISLAIKIAVATGTVRRFVVGQPNIQLIDVLAGETLSRMNEAAEFLAKGEIIITPEIEQLLLGQLDIIQHRANLAIIRGLNQTMPPQPWGSLPTLEASVIQEWVLPEVYQRLNDPFLAEIRPTVALFMSFQGLNYDHDETASHKLADYIKQVQDIIAKHGGYLIQLTLGDKGSYLYITFGALVTQADNTLQAVTAALALQELALEKEFITEVKLGLSQGRMYTGMYGSVEHGTFGVLGPQVNLAARLMSKAPKNSIWVTEAIANEVKKHYQFVSEPPQKFKGIEQDVFVARLIGAETQNSRLPVLDASCIGREQELQKLTNWAGLVREGQGQLVLVEGEPGMGKSHLLASFGWQLQTQNWQVAVGYCHPMSSPYQLWRTVLTQLLGEAITLDHVVTLLTELLPDRVEYAPLLGEVLGQSWENNQATQNLSPQVRHGVLQALIIAMLQAWAKQRPLALILEDTHWLDKDDLSREVLTGLAYQLTDVPLLVLVGQRVQNSSFNVAAEYAQRLVLTELSMADLPLFVRQDLNGEVDSLVVEVATRGSKNPFFIKQILLNLKDTKRLLQNDDLIWQLSPDFELKLRQANCLTKNQVTGAWQLSAPLPAEELPLTIDGLILARFDRLSLGCQTMLNIASVMGNEFQKGWLDEVDAELTNTLAEAIDHDFITSATHLTSLIYQFRHHHLREVIYNKLLPSKLESVHQEVGTALERFDPQAFELLAYHFEQGRMPAKELVYGERAADKARQRYANEAAKNYYRRLLQVEERATWRKAYTEILHLVGDDRDGERVSLEKLADHGEVIGMAEINLLWGKHYEAISEFAQAQVFIEQALQQTTDVRARISGLTQLGLLARRQSQFEQAKLWYNQALDLCQNQAIYTNNQIEILNGLGLVYRDLGEFEVATTYNKHALALSRQVNNRPGEAHALNSLGVIAYRQRNLAEAKICYQQAIQLRRNIGDSVGEGGSLLDLAILLRETGDYKLAEQHLLRSLTMQIITKNRLEEGNICNGLGILYLYISELSKARYYFQRDLAILQKISSETYQAYTLGNLGVIACLQKDWLDAENFFTASLDIAEKSGLKELIAMCRSYLATVSLQTDKIDQAIEQANNAIDIRGEINQKILTTMDLTTLALAYWAKSDLAQARQYAQQALTILEECGGQGPEFPHWDYFNCYRVLQVTGEEAMATAALQAAYHLTMERAEKITDGVIRQSFLRQEMNQKIIAAVQLSRAKS